MSLEHYKMTDCTFPEVQAYLEKNQTSILPYALSEQHGAHLPLDTDIRNAEYVSAALARQLDCLIAPTLNYTFSGGMFPGTINIKPTTFCNLVGEIIESLYQQGFRNFIIIPGHGGSESLLILKESLRILKWLNLALADALIMLIPIWDYSPTWFSLFDEKDYHAAEAETSLLLHWSPDVVRLDKVALDEPEVAERLRQDPDSYQLRESLTDNPHEIVRTSQRQDVKLGVMGYPEKASAELGRRIEAEFLKNGVEAIAKAIAAAEEARKNGQRFTHDNGAHLKIRSV